MKELEPRQAMSVGGGLEQRQSDDEVAPDPSTGDPLVVIDYNPPQQPQ